MTQVFQLLFLGCLPVGIVLFASGYRLAGVLVWIIGTPLFWNLRNRAMHSVGNFATEESTAALQREFGEFTQELDLFERVYESGASVTYDCGHKEELPPRQLGVPRQGASLWCPQCEDFTRVVSVGPPEAPPPGWRLLGLDYVTAPMDNSHYSAWLEYLQSELDQGEVIVDYGPGRNAETSPLL